MIILKFLRVMRPSLCILLDILHITARYMKLVTWSEAGGKSTAQTVKHQCQGLKRSIDYGARQPNPTAMICQEDRWCHGSLASCL